MNVYKRPLFMQQGGMARVPMPTPPAAMRPMPTPQGAMPPMRPAAAPMAPPRAPAAAPAARPTDQAAGIASMVSDKAKADLAQAQGPEQIINAFRGNQKPLEARYEELAQYVGPQDATSTPISVLTMVQPALMMTAKGAADSGIGELMANVAGKVNMESAPGQANRMGQGLGNIMMSRQAPQPAGMAQGGVVGKFTEGGNPLVEYYKQDLPAFQEILAPSQQDKDAAKRQLFFDIAQRGLAMAGGAGGTGNVASQLANVFQTLPGTYAAQQAELRKGERAAQQAALQSASGRVGADREQQAKLAEIAEESRLRRLENQQKNDLKILELNKKAELEGRDVDIQQYVDQNGNTIGRPFDMRDPTDRAAALALGDVVQGTLVSTDKISGLRGAGASSGIKRVRKTDGSVETFDRSIPSQDAAYRAAMQAGAQELKVEIPDVFEDQVLLETLVAGTTSPQQIARLNAAIADKTSLKEIATGDYGPGGIEITRNVPGERLPEAFDRAILQAREKGLDVQLPPYLSQSQPQPVAGDPQQANPLFADYDAQVGTGQPLSLTEIQSVALPDLGAEPSGIQEAVMEYPIERMFGTWAKLDRTFNTYAPALLGLIGPEAASAAAPEQAEANAEQGLAAFHTLVVESMLAARPGRASNESRQVLARLLPNINEATTTKTDALGKYKALEGEMTTDLRRVEGFLSQPLSQADYQKYDFIRRELGDRLKDLNTIVTQLQGSTPGGKSTPASDFDNVYQTFLENTKVPYAPN